MTVTRHTVTPCGGAPQSYECVPRPCACSWFLRATYGFHLFEQCFVVFSPQLFRLCSWFFPQTLDSFAAVNGLSKAFPWGCSLRSCRSSGWVFVSCPATLLSSLTRSDNFLWIPLGLLHVRSCHSANR